MLKTLFTTGLLKSVSIKIVFLPMFAKVIAKFATVVVLPSPGPALETIRDFTSAFGIEYKRVVLKLLYASAIGDFGLSNVINCLSIDPLLAIFLE